MATASASVQGIANNSGLQVGYVYARGVESGMDSVMKSADFMAAAVPQIPSQLATTALGLAGQLGPSGGGGQIEKALSVDLTNTSGPGQQPIVVNLTHVTTLDGQVLDKRTDRRIVSALDGYANAMQSG